MLFPNTAGGERDLFRHMLKELVGGKRLMGVEIGCLNGDSASVILEANPDIHLISIDPFIPDSMEPSLIGSFDKAVERNKKAEEEHRYIIMRSYSKDVVAYFSNKTLDFLFVDGDHRYEGVLEDYNNYTPLIKKGGLLFMHDCRMGREGGANFHPGPSRVLQEKVVGNPNWLIIAESFSLVCARKEV